MPTLRMTSAVRKVVIVLLVLAVGAAGFLLARATTPSSPDAIPVGGDANSTASPVPDPTVATPTPLSPDVSAISQGQVSSTTFQAADDLPNASSVAVGYRIATGKLKPQQLAAVIAQQFGVLGSAARTDEGGWKVGGTSDLDPVINVYNDPLVRWMFTDEQLTAGPAVDQDRAKQIAITLLSPLGVPVDEVEWEILRDQNRVVVHAWLVLKGLRTELGWTVVVAPDGEVVWADGFAATLVPVPGYPVLGATDALNRALKPGWQFAGPTPWTGSGAGIDVAVPGPVPTVKGKPALVAGVLVLTANRAELGLAQFWQPDGSLLILPSYVITTSDDRKWTLLAVTNAYIDVRDMVPAADVPNPAIAVP
ncbi:MAG: hypothetical protein Q8M73_02955 [Actinomycetota bacterium]|nr:hypothetical protein [Actinomycetota bacterium]